MRIGIDTHFLADNPGGITTFLKGFLREISKVDEKNKYFFFFQRGKPAQSITNYSISKIVKRPITKYYFPIWFNFILPKQLRNYKIELFFSPNHFLPIKKLVKKEVILIHDLAWRVNLRWKNLGYRIYARLSQRNSIQRADKIITVSKSTKKDIIKFYPVNGLKEKIEVIYEAADKEFKPRILNQWQQEKLRTQYRLPRRFILYVGDIEERKNIRTLIKIINELTELRNKKWRDLKLVIIGNIGPEGEIYRRKIQDNLNILWLRNVTDKNLYCIYNLAEIFLFPSFYEGFGFGPLEAMQSGVPVLTSNTSSLPEVVGEGGLMHSPNDYKGFVKDIIRLLEDKRFYREIKEKGIEEARKFNWRKSTESLIKIFKSLSA